MSNIVEIFSIVDVSNIVDIFSNVYVSNIVDITNIFDIVDLYNIAIVDKGYQYASHIINLIFPCYRNDSFNKFWVCLLHVFSDHSSERKCKVYVYLMSIWNESTEVLCRK